MAQPPKKRKQFILYFDLTMRGKFATTHKNHIFNLADFIAKFHLNLIGCAKKIAMLLAKLHIYLANFAW